MTALAIAGYIRDIELPTSQAGGTVILRLRMTPGQLASWTLPVTVFSGATLLDLNDFYEKVIKVKADVAAILALCRDHPCSSGQCDVVHSLRVKGKWIPCHQS